MTSSARSQRLRRLTKGPIALMSFDPAVMASVKKLAPNVARGIVSGSYAGSGWWTRRIGRKRAVGLRNLLEFGACRAAFLRLRGQCTPDARDRVRTQG